MGGKGGSSKVQVAEYRMSIHFGLCAGPVDALLGVSVGEKSAWTGEVTKETEIQVSNTELFGGVKKQGGVRGIAHYLPGGRMQTMSDALAGRFGKTKATCPGFRGVASIFFVGDGSAKSSDPLGVIGTILGALWGGSTTGASGFYWGANSPYLQTIWGKVRRIPRGLNPAIARIGDDANPSHMIFECLTNVDWGMGSSVSSLDVTSFELAAQTLYTENFGLSMMWARSDTIEAFVSEILNHIQAVLYAHPRTGLLTLKLLRDDYSHDSVPIINPDNAKLSKFQRKLLGETTNEIVVTWTNPENEKSETVTAQDLANISMQGCVVSDSRNYYGVRNSNLAMSLADRDLRAAALPLLGCEAELDRTQWSVVPGDVLNLVWPEYEVASVLVRVIKADYGRPTDAKIKVVIAEDIFGLESSTFTAPPGSSWANPAEDPTPMGFVLIGTAPAYLVANVLSENSLQTLGTEEVISIILAAQNSADTSGFDLYAEASDVTGTLSWTDLGSKSLISTATLAADLAFEAVSIVTGFLTPIGSAPRAGTFVFIGDGDETAIEIALVQSIDDTGVTLLRGLLDTVPRVWDASSRVWFVGSDFGVADTTIRSASETVEYKLLTKTSRGILSLDAAPINSATLTSRPHLPLRPANVQIEDEGYDPVDGTGLETLTVSWANRNRLSETTQVLRWSDATTTPEQDQTTTVRLLDATGALIKDIDGQTGTTYELAVSEFGARDTGWVQVISKRGGLESLQGHKIQIINLNVGLGYGRRYGKTYGGPR